jgi:RND superfamily putative drug exporter
MERLLEKWGQMVARWPLAIVLAWVALVVAALHFSPSIDAVAQNQNLSSLPASAPSQRAAQLYDTKFLAGQRSASNETDLLILTDSRGISDADIALAQRVVAWLTNPATRPAHLLSASAPGPQAPVSAFESADHQALRLPVTWNTTNASQLQDSVSAIDTYLAQLTKPAGVTIGLFGSASINRDFFSTIFSGSGVGIGMLLGLLIILVVLGFVYRSPLAVLVPLATIGMAFALSIGVVAWFGQLFGLLVQSFSLEYVFIVLLGAGTNYGVFLLSRYREEIRRGNGTDKTARRGALARAVGRVGESISSSALTVVVATGVMGLAQLALLKVTGPAVAVAVACLLLAGLTLLPALMALCGRALFWPARPRPGTLAANAVPERGLWASAGRLVTEHPRLLALISLLLLAPLAISSLMVTLSFDDLRSLPDSAPSKQAFAAYQQHFNDVTQVQVYVSAPGHDLRQPEDAAALAALATALEKVPHVTGVQAPSMPNGQPLPAGTTLPPEQVAQFFATDGSAAQLTLSLDIDASSQDAINTVGAIYDRADQTLQGSSLAGADVFVGGQSGFVYDESAQLGTDFRLVVLLACLAIYVILALLLRSLTAPLYLIATIALSAGTAIGLTDLVYHDLLGQPIFYLVPLLAFIFLVALGEDFNILTMARIREETAQPGQRRGVAAAVALTGGVVSSCGLVMAASFSRLATNPILELAESGFAICAGVLIDTFIVRPLLVPAIATLLGRWNWVWPGRRVSVVAGEDKAVPERLVTKDRG